MKRLNLHLCAAMLTFMIGTMSELGWRVLRDRRLAEIPMARLVEPILPSAPPVKKRSVPDDFKRIEFANFTYPYQLSPGKSVNIALKNGQFEYEFSNDQGWFNLSNVYYVDVTSDKRPEAIVILWHVSCGVSCDGGAALFYVYSVQQDRLKLLWRYETGSLAYGCGLKSLTSEDKKLSLELFGQCLRGKHPSGRRKFEIEDITRLTFVWKDRGFVADEKKLISWPESSVKNYEPKFNINH